MSKDRQAFVAEMLRFEGRICRRICDNRMAWRGGDRSGCFAA